MSKDIKDLDDVVEAISKRVAEKLQEKEGVEKTFGLTTIKVPTSKRKFYADDEPKSASRAGETVDYKLAGMIDHTLLAPDASKSELETVCREAMDYNFCTVCVNSCNIPYVASLLAGSSVKPIAVIGFPLGAATTQAKVFETKEAVSAGAKEIDMVINIGALKSKDYVTVCDDIKAVVDAAKPYPVKVILENSKLTQDEKIIACALSKTARAAFVKTSTGFGGGGATAEDIALMRKIVGEDMQVKASGGVRSREDADAMIKAGADRIGASASVAIVTGKKSNSSY